MGVGHLDLGGFWSLLGDLKACEGFLPQGGLVTRLFSSWDPVEGTQDICSCCEMRSCGFAGHSRRLPAPSRWQGGRVRREQPSELGRSWLASWAFGHHGNLLRAGWLEILHDLLAPLCRSKAWESECSKILSFRPLGERSRCCGWTSLHPQLAGSPSEEDTSTR